MKVIGEISEIWRYPVKSMGGEQLQSANITAELGVEKDRYWTLRDEEWQEIVNGRRIPEILMLAARFTGENDAIEITMPDGSSVVSTDPYASAEISTHLGRSVTLASQQAKDSDHYKYHHMVTPKDMRKVMGRPGHSPLPDLSRIRFPDLIELLRFAAPRGTHFDFNRLTFVTTASLRGLQEMLPDAKVDVRRFRPNFVIDTIADHQAYDELKWAGWQLMVGDLKIACRSPAIRCTIPGQRQIDLPASPQIQMAIRNSMNEDFGVYADSLNDGQMKVGDEVKLVPPQNAAKNKFKIFLNKFTINALSAPNLLIDKLEQKGRISSKPHAPKKYFREVTLTEKKEESSDAVSLTFDSGAQSDAPWFMPGQQMLFRFDVPGQSKPAYRTYALSSSAENTDSFRITIKKESGGNGAAASDTVHQYLTDAITTGTKIWVRGPLGKYFVNPNHKKPVVFITMGIGLAPIMSMAQTIAKVNPEREMWAFHGVKDGSDFALKDEFMALPEKSNHAQVFVHQSQGSAQEGIFTGRLDFSFIQGKMPHLDGEFYICGNGEFTSYFHKELSSAGVPAENIHYEFFRQGQKLGDSSQEDNSRYSVQFTRTGMELEWEPEAKTLLNLAEQNGVPVEFGCRYGNCHACECTLVSGDVERFDEADPPQGENTILLCTTRPKSNLVIDA